MPVNAYMFTFAQLTALNHTHTHTQWARLGFQIVPTITAESRARPSASTPTACSSSPTRPPCSSSTAWCRSPLLYRCISSSVLPVLIRIVLVCLLGFGFKADALWMNSLRLCVADKGSHAAVPKREHNIYRPIASSIIIIIIIIVIVIIIIINAYTCMQLHIDICHVCSEHYRSRFFSILTE